MTIQDSTHILSTQHPPRPTPPPPPTHAHLLRTNSPPPPAPSPSPRTPPLAFKFHREQKVREPIFICNKQSTHHSSEIIINKFNIMVLALALKLTNFKLIILDWKSGNVGGNIQHWCSFKITLHSIFKERYVLFKERYVLFK